MSSKPETTFYTGVHKALPPAVYREKMSNPYRGGTPDVYYEGARGLWCEYKFNDLPARMETMMTPGLSALQEQWLNRCHSNGHSPVVIMGAYIKNVSFGFIFERPACWSHGISAGHFVENKLTKKEIADFITRRVYP